MPITKTTQLSATVINYPYLDKERPVAGNMPLVIESALYYNPDLPTQQLDVEPYITRLLVNNRLEFIVENETFGGNRSDPAPGIVKAFRMVYRYNGIRSELECKEKSTVVLLAY